jgi:hypothetical protein
MFAATTTREIRVVLDTCSTLDDEPLAAYQDRAAHPERVTAYPGHGWLYEVEVFARIPRHEAWLRSLTD